jgi:hypothetical protein
MSNQLTRRDFAIRTAGFGLALGLTPAATLAEVAEQASRSETSPAVADPYSLVNPELLPTLKQFPTFDFSAEMVGEFRQTPGMPPLLVPAPQPVKRHIPSPQHQKDRLDPGGTHASSDGRDHRGRVDKKELPAMEPGAMCYMMSKQGYGGDSVEHWPPHLMFYFSQTTLQSGERVCPVLPSSLLATPGST